MNTILKSSKSIFSKTLAKLSSRLSHESYLKIKYALVFKTKLKLDKPQTFNEKIQHLKLKQTSGQYNKLSDKYLVREHIKSTLGDSFLPDLYWVGTDPKAIPFNELPSSFVIKCNHGSGYNLIIRDKNKINYKKIINKLESWLKSDYWKISRELNYKDIPRKIIIEELLTEGESEVPKDYKVFCFNSKAKYIQVDYDRFGKHKRNIYSKDWELLDFGLIYPQCHKKHKKPKNLNQMIKHAENLTKNLTFARVDFFDVKNQLYVGEITFYPESGFGHFYPKHKSIDKKLGKYIYLK